MTSGEAINDGASAVPAEPAKVTVRRSTIRRNHPWRVFPSRPPESATVLGLGLYCRNRLTSALTYPGKRESALRFK